MALLSTTIPGFLLSIRLNLAFVLVTMTALFWFIAEFTQMKPRWLLWGLSGVVALLFLVNLVQPFTLQYKEVQSITFQTMPWGETVATLQGSPVDHLPDHALGGDGGHPEGRPQPLVPLGNPGPFPDPFFLSFCPWDLLWAEPRPFCP